MSNIRNCRLCLIKQEASNCKQIYEETYESTDIYNMIKYCLPQVSHIKKSLDSVICLQCLGKLYLCYDFVSTCYRNDEEFKINNRPDDIIESWGPIVDESNVAMLGNIVQREDVNENGLYAQGSLSKYRELLPTVRSMKKASSKFHRNKFRDKNCAGCKNRLFNAKYHAKVQSDHFDCFHCDKRHFSCESIKKHVYKHMLRTKCDICDKKCRDKYSLNLHLQTHTKKKMFECPVCGKSFMQSYALNQHIGIHDPNGNNKCQICDKILSTKYNLKIHMTMHNVKAKPRCHVCNKWFYTECARDKHSAYCEMGFEANKDDVNEFIEPDFVKIEDLPSTNEEEDDVFVETNSLKDNTKLLDIPV